MACSGTLGTRFPNPENCSGIFSETPDRRLSTLARSKQDGFYEGGDGLRNPLVAKGRPVTTLLFGKLDRPLGPASLEC